MMENIILDCKKTALEMRKNIIKIAKDAGSSHIGGSLSEVDILAVLYKYILDYDSKNPMSEDRDRVILSKGHTALALYIALNQINVISDEDLMTFKNNETYLYEHPSMKVDKGIEFSGGSLGQGLSQGVGTALALRLKKNNKSKVYVIMGDGECQEGSVWESVMSASHYNLNNIIAIVDKNGLQMEDFTKNIMNIGSITEKFKSFDWDVIEIDGHNYEEIYNSLLKEHNRPYVIIANTIKGKGISFMENNPLFHHSKLSQKQFEDAMKELEVI